jgi:hypothetical protein
VRGHRGIGYEEVWVNLTDKAVRNAAKAEKPYNLPDGAGLHLLVTPAGGRLWRYRYEFPAGKEKMLAQAPIRPCPWQPPDRYARTRACCSTRC